VDIEKARKAVTDFFSTILGKDAKIIKIGKSEGGWMGEAEVYEESSFIKSLGLPTRVKDRNVYEFSLNDDLEVNSYALKEGE